MIISLKKRKKRGEYLNISTYNLASTSSPSSLPYVLSHHHCHKKIIIGEKVFTILHIG